MAARMLPGLIACLVILLLAGDIYGRSVMSPRRSGMDAPGGPRQMDILPGNSPGRTAEGGMGYTDAYGNTLTDKVPEEKVKRPRKQAQRPPATLPEVSIGEPVWTFK
ncbi:MAG: hypothetical protein HDQ44_04990 [Desulfovibrio sp.]|nr:hypothetical protein [Desulfovibrio sp.]